MAGKHRKVKDERAPTRRQLSKWEKQKRLSRIIIISTLALVIILAGVIGVGIYLEQVAPYQEVVVKVDDVSYDLDYYIRMLDLLTLGQSDSTILSYYTDIAANTILQSEVIKNNAAEAGITVTGEEIDKELEAENLDKSDVGVDLVRTRLIAQKYMQQQCLPKQPRSVEQVEVQAMMLENEAMATERKQKLLLGENFTSMASMLSIESTTQSKGGYLGWIPEGYEGYTLGSLQDSAIGDTAFKLSTGEISNPVYDATVEKPYGYWILEVIEKDSTKGVHARGILCGNRDDAESARAKLQSGADWSEIARQYSQDPSKDNGGDLGWRVPGMDEGMLDRIVSTLETNKISDVIRDDSISTKGGYWIIKVLNKEDRPLDSDISQTLADECLYAWIEGLMKEAKTENLLDDEKRELAVQKVIKNRSK